MYGASYFTGSNYMSWAVLDINATCCQKWSKQWLAGIMMMAAERNLQMEMLELCQ